MGFKGTIFSTDKKQERIEKAKIEINDGRNLKDIHRVSPYSAKLRSNRTLVDKNEEQIANSILESKEKEDREMQMAIEES